MSELWGEPKLTNVTRNDTLSTIIDVIIWPTIVLIFGIPCWFLFTSDAGTKHIKENLLTIETMDAGNVESFIIHSGSWSIPTTAMINTTKGSYTIPGYFSFTKGDTARIEVRSSGNRYICVNETNKCYKVVQ